MADPLLKKALGACGVGGLILIFPKRSPNNRQVPFGFPVSKQRSPF